MTKPPIKAELEQRLVQAEQESLALRRRIDEGLEIIARISEAITSAPDLRRILLTVAGYGARLFDLDTSGAFIALDGTRYEWSVQHGGGEPFTEVIDVSDAAAAHTVIGQAIRERRLVEALALEQAADDPHIPSIEPETVRAALAVPMLQGERVVGGIALWSHTAQPFDRELVDFLQSLVRLCVNLVENVRLLESEREQRQLAEAMHQVGLALGSTLEPDAVLDRLLELMVEVIPYDAACVMLIEQDIVRIVRMRGYERFGLQAAELARLEFQLSETANLRHIVETGNPAIVADTWDDPAWIQLSGLEYIRSWIGAPIQVQGQIVGVLSLDSAEPGFYRPAHLRLLASFAAQAALALQNARLFDAEARRRQEAETLWAAAQALGKTLDLGQVFNLILQELQKVVPYDSASVHQLEGSFSRIIGGRGFLNPEQIIGLRFDMTRTDNPNREVVLSGAPFILDDAPARYAEFHRSPHAPAQIHSWLGVPLLFGDRLIGMLALDKREPGFYSQEHARLVAAFANQAAIAIENSRLYAQAQREIEERTRVEVSLRQSQEALRASEALYRTTLDAMRDIIHVVDADLRLVLVNKAFLQWQEKTGRATEVVGRHLFDIFAFLPERVRDEYTQVFESGQLLVTEGRIEVLGEEYYTESIKIPVFDGARVECVVTVIHNVTERKRLEAQFRQAQKMEIFGRLAGGIAHDFNNMLTAIMGYSELVLDGLTRSDPNFEELVEIMRVSERAAELTKQLLVFSRKQEIDLKTLSINEVVSGIERMLLRLIGEDIELKAVLEPLAGSIKADRSQIEQALLNLAVNARDAMPQGGRLIIQTENVTLDHTYTGRYAVIPPGAYVLILVSDTGVGMSQDVQNWLFEPFFTTKEPGKGTGLGLTTVYWIVQQCKGYVDVKSDLGRGTIFYLYFPRVMPLVPPPHVATEKTSPAGSETILLVEDEVMVRNLAERILSRSGYRVLTAQNGQEALDLCRAYPERIDLLLTDVVMPLLSGRELAEQITVLCPQIKVLYMSGHVDDTIVYYGVQRSEFAFLQKPFSLRSLMSKVRDVLDRE